MRCSRRLLRRRTSAGRFHDQFIGNIDGLDSAERFRVNTSKFEGERFNMKECTDDKNENRNDTQDITDGVGTTPKTSLTGSSSQQT